MEAISNFPYTQDSDWDENLRQWLEGYIIKYPHHNTSVLSRSQYIGIPRSVLDSYLEKKYFSPKSIGGEGNYSKSSKVETSIRSYREKIGESIRDKSTADSFVETTTWKQLRNALRIALNENVIIVAYGKPGIGKSKCLMEFSLQEMVIPPIKILCSRNVTADYFVTMICEQLGVKRCKVIAETENRICEKLNKNPRALFVDQANYLMDRSFGSVCHIWEKTKIPIALIGTRDLYDAFMKSKMTEDVRAQLTSRIAVHYLLAELQLDEVKAIVENKLGEQATNEIIAQIYNITGGIYRNLDMIIARITDLQNKNIALLDSGELNMSKIVSIAGSRLMLA